jgi:hypothetical protein
MTAKNIIVVADGKKFKVLVDYIQRGPLYASKENAEKQAELVADSPC